MEASLARAVRDAASRSGVSVSRWFSQAASDHLRNQRLGSALDEWEAEDGPFTDQELSAAASLLGVGPVSHRVV